METLSRLSPGLFALRGLDSSFGILRLGHVLLDAMDSFWLLVFFSLVWNSYKRNNEFTWNSRLSLIHSESSKPRSWSTPFIFLYVVVIVIMDCVLIDRPDFGFCHTRYTRFASWIKRPVIVSISKHDRFEFFSSYVAASLGGKWFRKKSTNLRESTGYR